MSDNDDLELDPETPEEQERQRIRQLRERAKSAGEFERRATEAERKLALVTAGVDMTKPLHRLFADGYRGDTTPDAVREAMTGYGLVEQPPKALEVPPGELDAHDRISAASQGARDHGEKPWKEIVDEHMAKLPRGGDANAWMVELYRQHGKEGQLHYS